MFGCEIARVAVFFVFFFAFCDGSITKFCSHITTTHSPAYAATTVTVISRLRFDHLAVALASSMGKGSGAASR